MKETKNKLKEKPNTIVKEKPDTKKLFEKGGPGGPGRPKAQADEADIKDPLELAMTIIRQDLKSKEVTVRQKAVSMLVQILKLKQAIKSPYAEGLTPSMQLILQSIAGGKHEFEDDELAQFLELIDETEGQGPGGE